MNTSNQVVKMTKRVKQVNNLNVEPSNKHTEKTNHNRRVKRQHKRTWE